MNERELFTFLKFLIKNRIYLGRRVADHQEVTHCPVRGLCLLSLSNSSSRKGAVSSSVGIHSSVCSHYCLSLNDSNLHIFKKPCAASFSKHFWLAMYSSQRHAAEQVCLLCELGEWSARQVTFAEHLNLRCSAPATIALVVFATYERVMHEYNSEK